MLSAILLPPGINLILLVIGFYGLKKFRRIAITLLYLAGLSLYLLATPIFSNLLLAKLESEPAPSFGELRASILNNPQPMAILVLSDGRLSQAAEYGSIDTVNASTLERLRFASWLHRKLELPLLISGGNNHNDATSEGVLMNQVLLSSFLVAPKWIDSASQNMVESAINSKAILNDNNISTIVLVSHALDMPRAKSVFNKIGINVLAAPISFKSQANTSLPLSLFLPSFNALYHASQALEESAKRIWYGLII